MTDHNRIGMEVSIAIAEAVKLCDADAIAAYPITPQTHVVEHLAEIVADGHLDAEFIPVESEHSAMSACIGTAATGARTFTATASQGLALMVEIMYIASSMRMPIVMTVANRALSAPISIWGDHSDVMLARDTGWIQYFVENGQEALDLTICAFKIAEDKRVKLPVIVNFDGFTLSHVVEPIEMIERDAVEAFLPKNDPVHRLDPANPVSMGPVGIPEIYTESKKAHDVALIESQEVIEEVWAEFSKTFGREYKVVEGYRAEDADTLLLAQGSMTETMRGAIDEMRDQGRRVGLLRLRLWRPFPYREVKEAIGNARTVIVFDRSLSPGGPGGPLASEIKAALYNQPEKPTVISFIGGLGGRDMRIKDFTAMILKGENYALTGSIPHYEMVGVRE